MKHENKHSTNNIKKGLLIACLLFLLVYLLPSVNATYNFTGFNFSVAAQDTVPTGITFNGSLFFVVGDATNMVYSYYSNGSFTGFNFSVNAQDSGPIGITYTNNSFYLVGYAKELVFEYSSAGAYTGYNFSVKGKSPQDISTNTSSLFILESTGAISFLHEFLLNGTNTTYKINVTSSDTLARGVGNNGSKLYVVGDSTNSVYEYALNVTEAADTTPPTWSNNQTNASSGLAAQGSVQLNITWADETALSWNFIAHNDSGTLRNVSNWSISGTSYKLVFNLTVTSAGQKAWQSCANDTSNNWNCSSLFSFDVAGGTVPGLSLISQVPANINQLNLLGKGLNATYSIADADGINTTKTNLSYKVNDTSSDGLIFINGTSTPGYSSSGVITTNVSGNFSFYVPDYKLLPGTYNLEQGGMETTTHSSYELYSGFMYVKIRLLNVSAAKNNSILEVMVQNETKRSLPLQVYYCNESYTNGSVVGSPFCYGFYLLNSSLSVNHTHSANSKHAIIPFSINKSSGKIGNVAVSSVSYFLLRGRQYNSWNFSYIENSTSNLTTQTTRNGGISWSNFSGTVDAHLLQFNNSETVYFYASSSDGLGNANSSSVTSDIIEFRVKPPSGKTILERLGPIVAVGTSGAATAILITTAALLLRRRRIQR